MASIFLVVSLLLFIIYAVLIIYYRYGWSEIPSFGVLTSFKPDTKITVVIPARNEAENIGACLQSVILQDYPSHLFDIMLVDDHSTDETASVAASFQQPNLVCISLQDFVNDPINSYKKKAIEVAISQSTGDLIVTTDADCIVTKDWLKTIASFYQEYRPAFIAAPVVIDGEKRFIEIFQALDFMTLQGITGASVYKRMHSMCNGANLAYERSAFVAVDGFKGIESIASGDDMLLMHKIYKLDPDRVMFLKSRAAIVRTGAVKNWNAFINQRIRWASKSGNYEDKSLLPVLITVYFLNVLLLILPVIGLFSTATFSVGNFNFSLFTFWFLLLILKTFTELFFLLPVAAFFQKQSLLKYFPLMQPVHIIYTVVAGWLGKFGSYQWKQRKVN